MVRGREHKSQLEPNIYLLSLAFGIIMGSSILTQSEVLPIYSRVIRISANITFADPITTITIHLF